MRRIWIAAAICLTGIGAAADGAPSPGWEDLREQYLPGGEVRFDQTLRLMTPDKVEQSFQVPVIVKLGADLGRIEELVVIAENNPIQQVVRIHPHERLESVGLNIRLEMSTPVHTAARTADGVWHVASKSVLVPPSM
ncbi:MAG: thiosulfate oxidation carrier protein SoxY [Alphaproteobacteria bacterium]|jgi:sulfur-oxidizing protein SoxY|nr:thiosulfate oxidation carrier protein SoxY [Alphaproteobacteria bacterium]MDP6515797.1 thiosulfate oxidation carrier protein SoxY [Alphaproteobacteria bacterium]